MFRFKWKIGANAAQREVPSAAARDIFEPFDFGSLLTKSRLRQALSRFVFRTLMPIIFAVLRVIAPVLRIRQLVVLSRHAEVAAVLSDRNGNFEVVYGPEIAELGEGTNFVLGLDGDEHQRHRGTIARDLIDPVDIANIETITRETAAALIDAGAGRLDVIRDLVTRTASEATCRFLGISPRDPDAFAEWTMAVSMLLFADPFGDANVRKQALIAGEYIRRLIDDEIDRARRQQQFFNPAKRSAEEIRARWEQSGLLERMIVRGDFNDAEARATILGLATGFIPTNTLAAGNILEELLDNPALYDAARQAAMALAAARKAKDKAAETTQRELLEEALLKAAAHYPALTPGIWRQVPRDVDIDVGSRKLGFKAGTFVLASISSALRDGRRPRPASTGVAAARDASDLIFGAYPHRCLGAHLAMAHIIEVFAALLAQPGLKPARGRHGRIWRAGPYPVRLDMDYDCPTAQRCLLVAAVPLRAGVAIKEVEDALDAIGNPASVELAAALDRTGCIQFASLNVIERGDDEPSGFLIVEINGDGSEGHVLDQFATAAEAWLAPVLTMCAPADNPPATAHAMARLMQRHVLDLRQRPWDTMGLHFDGLADMSVADIERQANLAEWALTQIDMRMKQPGLTDGRPIELLLHLRRILKKDIYYARRKDFRQAMEEAEKLQIDGAIIRPSRKRLALAGWKERDLLSITLTTLRAPDNRFILIGLALVSLLCAIPVYRLALPDGEASAVQQVLAITAAVLSAPLLALLAAAMGFGVFLLLVRRAEKREPSDPRNARLKDVEAITEREDARGFEQNHIIAVMPLKRGMIRRLSFAFSMWWIRQAVTHWFRPGFVVTMGTIHKARWFVVPGTRQFVFHSNYDGSWESYLEDFITRANQGQTSAWSHGEGFPPTRFLILDGAADGDRFKRWVRRQQRPSRCWYSRFHHLTAKQIRNNAMIEDGLARADNDTDARRWLANFGSAQREVDELETHEVQSIVFSGLGHHHLATTLAIKLPPDPDEARKWLWSLIHLPKDGPRADAPRSRVRFGDVDLTGPVATLGLSAKGLGHLGLREGMGLDQLPNAFRMGMHGRQRVLGDDHADGWRWSDSNVQAVLTIYTENADDGAGHAEEVARQILNLVSRNGEVLARVPCTPLREPKDGAVNLGREHFGFRDGISQPVIRGTRKAATTPPPRDVLAPGEFLMGYRNDQGYVSPSVAIGAEHDPRSRLPTVAEQDPNRFPLIGNRSSEPDLRDFGRNCTFLVLRQLDQDVDEFQKSTERHARALNGEDGGKKPTYPHLSDLVGGEVDSEWVAAKIIGRWPDGSPLVGNPSRPAGLSPFDAPDNDFAYGVDDPRGFACPLGAHIRRTNPRDSLEPGDAAEQAITNRHRILRRGRAYAYHPEGEAQEVKGLLFAALCSDLERQFEFIQHTWINATSFHGLTQEADPLLGNPLTEKGQFPHTTGSTQKGLDAIIGGTNTRFTIPTAGGPVVIKGLESYVTLRAGGYFMLPSRSALQFLAGLPVTGASA
jgi:cytochrome P450/deferrochelatase/peroxidase EfeB